MAVAPALSASDAQRVNAVTSRYRAAIAAGIRAALDASDDQHGGLMRQHFGFDDTVSAAAGGKMLRPALLLLSCEAVGGQAAQAMNAAVAVELVHNFTLIHDDIEDASDTRHGRETLWRSAGLPLAINAGDGMFVLAQRTLLRLADSGVSPERVLWASRTLNDACAAVCEGQHRDISFESRHRVSLAEYMAMIDGKTGALLGASMAIGAIAGGASDTTVSALGACGQMLGRAFQIQDDVLGIWGDPSTTGKPIADDVRSRKRSFPIAWAFDHLTGAPAATLERMYGSEALSESDVDAIVSMLSEAEAAEAARSEALRWARASVDALEGLSMDDERRRDLSALAAFAVHRSA